jgi:hypothetical protein
LKLVDEFRLCQTYAGELRLFLTAEPEREKSPAEVQGPAGPRKQQVINEGSYRYH